MQQLNRCGFESSAVVLSPQHNGGGEGGAGGGVRGARRATVARMLLGFPKFEPRSRDSESLVLTNYTIGPALACLKKKGRPPKRDDSDISLSSPPVKSEGFRLGYHTFYQY